ncbi:MAG: hypothetical protein MUF83_00035 [Acidimicrobiales bacterium]|nr:hypothetical protein [Acidimicrobiales bacterium]
MDSRQLARRGTVAGVAVGLVATATLVAGGVLELPDEPDDRDASADFLAAWERSRDVTYAAEGEFARVLPGGDTLASATFTAQRPPDRISRSLGSVDGRLDDRPVICSTDESGAFSCVTGERVLPSYEEEVAGELDNLRAMFSGTEPALYRVRFGEQDGCFELTQQIVYPDPDYGRFAVFCFDPTTGVRTYVERHLTGGVVETEQALAVRVDVTANDFSLEDDPRFDPVPSTGVENDNTAP